MFGPTIALFNWLRTHIPINVRIWRPRMNFITLHYTYLVSMCLIGSIILYPGGSMPYVDALFFASGSATQSGLNTIDLNKIHLYQQVTCMLIAAVCNPIFINTFVVFVRLYWFEKRFQNVVLEARTLRRMKTKSRTKSEAKPDLDRDLGHEEAGVGNREITVVRDENGEIRRRKIEDDADLFQGLNGTNKRQSTDSNDQDGDNVSPGNSTAAFHRNITFADEVPATKPLEDRVPEKRSKEHIIAFVENQRNPKESMTLRIPGPRDYDLGLVPERIEESEEPLDRETTNEGEGNQLTRHRSSSVPHAMNQDDHPFKSHITFDDPDRPGRRPTIGPSAYNRPKPTEADTEAPTSAMHLRNRRSNTFMSFLSKAMDDEEQRDPMPYLSWTPTVGRNSAFVDLTEEQREELGGIEYRSLKLLAIILVFYYVGFHLFGMLCLLPWITRDKYYSNVVSEVGINPVWWGFFTPSSMFNDLGFSLTPDSMVSFQTAAAPLVVGIFLIIIGNTGFPCMLRFIIWFCSICTPHGSGVWEELKFLLDHPRRCFTLLFPSKANWWLFGILIALNCIDLIFFIILDLDNPVVTSLPPGYRVLDGLFQAAATRTAGFAVVSVADLHPATQVSYLIMMYISIFPIAISMRQTNVYEEKSLGVWSADDPDTAGDNSYLGAHLRRQLSFDLWFVFLGFFLLAIVEGGRLQSKTDNSFSLFAVLFEIISAYGTVGLSLGHPGINASLSAEFSSLGKLIIIAMQIRGRHRALPYALDRAIMLPSESLHKKEDEDAIRRARRQSMSGTNNNHTNSEFVVGDGQGGSGGLFRTGTGQTGRSTASGRRVGVPDRRQFGRWVSGALSAGPPTPVRERIVGGGYMDRGDGREKRA